MNNELGNNVPNLAGTTMESGDGESCRLVVTP
jgi:hypothetical protein